MFPTATYLVSVLAIVFFAPSDFTQQRCGHQSSSAPLLPSHFRDFDIPPLDPSKYIADQDREPFKILFIFVNTLSREMSEVLEDAAGKVNERLDGILKAPRLEEIRLEREWNMYGRCDPPTCDWDDSFIPGEYAMPCESPNGGIIFEHNVPCSVSKKVEQMNRERQVNLVIYVAAERASRKHIDYCGDEARGETETEAYSSSCQVDTNTHRPTHGYIGVCIGASELHGDKAERLILHEVLHILTHGNIVGMGSSKLGCPFDGNHVRSLLQCKYTVSQAINVPPCTVHTVVVHTGEGKTYKTVQQFWQQKDGTVIPRTRLLTITPSVVDAARLHFGCDTLEGAEIEAVQITKEQSEALGGTVQVGRLIPKSHWSRTLFPDEILMPAGCGHMRLSALTLGLLRDIDWYDVDMNAAEEMVATKPEPGEGCRIAETDYSAIVAMARSTQRRQDMAESRHPSGPYVMLRGDTRMGHYCDLDYGNKRRVRVSLCHNDREPQGCEEITNPWCGVLSRPDYYDSFACDKSRIVSGRYRPITGASVGPGTTCLTILPFRIEGRYTAAEGVCVEYQCAFDRKELDLIWKPKGAECRIICPKAASLKMWTFSVADNEGCKAVVGEEIDVICPNFVAVCLQDSAIDPDKTGNGAVTLKSGWVGVGSILFAMITMTVTG